MSQLTPAETAATKWEEFDSTRVPVMLKMREQWCGAVTLLGWPSVAPVMVLGPNVVAAQRSHILLTINLLSIH
jgi:hypothetical protein